MAGIFILLDIGGTQIKAGAFDEDGNIIGKILSVDSCSRKNQTIIFDNMASIIENLIQKNNSKNILGVGFAFPGPFDYENGISLLKGLDKYESIYGLSVEDEIKKRCKNLKNIKFYFMHDTESFATGEMCFGKAKDENKILCLCIGTGAGSVFIKDKHILKEEKDGVPVNGWIYPIPFKDSIIDDYISVRGLARLCMEITGESMNGKQLYELCLQKDRNALDIYKIFGENIALALLPFIDEFKPNAVVLGGQISKSFEYFGKELKTECEKRDVKIYKEYDTSLLAMQGLYYMMNREENKYNVES